MRVTPSAPSASLYSDFTTEKTEGECDDTINCVFGNIFGSSSMILDCQSGCRCRSTSSIIIIASVASGFFIFGFAPAMRIAMSAIRAMTLFSPWERYSAGMSRGRTKSLPPST